MKTSSTLSIIGLCLVALLFFQGNKKSSIKAPPGTVQISETLFIDQRPTTVMDYRVIEYFSLIVNLDCYADSIEDKWNSNQMMASAYHEKLRENCPSDSNEVSRIFLDRDYLASTSEHQYGEAMSFLDNYYNHPAYADHPLVGVSHKQAMDYCAWRTNAVKQGMMIDGRIPSTLPYKDFTYRLPTKEEWLNAQNTLEKSKEVAEKTNDVNSFIHWVELKGKKGYIGYSNISEMVLEEHVAIGRNYKLEEEAILSEFEYTNKAEWLGFRCICEMEI